MPPILAVLGHSSLEPSMFCSDQSPYHKRCSQYLLRSHDHSNPHATAVQGQTAEEKQSSSYRAVSDRYIQRKLVLSPESYPLTNELRSSRLYLTSTTRLRIPLDLNGQLGICASLTQPSYAQIYLSHTRSSNASSSSGAGHTTHTTAGTFLARSNNQGGDQVCAPSANPGSDSRATHRMAVYRRLSVSM